MYNGDIIIIDDSPEVCGVLKKQFEKLKFKTEICDSFAKYKALFKNRIYKVTLIDVILENCKSGTDLLPTLSKHTFPIFMSGYIASVLGNFFYEKKLSFIEKPIKKEDLEIIIEKIKSKT